MTDAQKDLNRAHLEYAAIILFILPFLNGIYNRALRNHPAVFWSLDVFQFIVLTAGVAWFLFTRSGLTAADLGLAKPANAAEWRRLLLHCLAVGLLFHPAYQALHDLFLHLYPVARFPPVFSWEQMLPRTPVWRCLAGIYFAIGGGLCEEFYYRGLLVALFRRYRMSNPLIGLVVSSIFSLIHWESGPYNILATFCLSVLITAYYLWSKRLAPLVVGHFVTDVIFFVRGS